MSNFKPLCKKRRPRHALAFAFLAAGFGASPAMAEIIETSAITSSFSYTVGSQSGFNDNAVGSHRIFLSDTTGGFSSDVGLALDATLDDGSFFFLHNAYCVGQCSVTIATQITFTLQNTGTDTALLRFDSLITPGHLSRSNFFGSLPGEGASFDFFVRQLDNSVAETLYSAFGSVGDALPAVTTSGEDFNNLLRDDNPPEWNVLDWSSTNLNLDLVGIAPGTTSTLIYYSELTVLTSNPVCLDTTECLGFQAAFGDPRSRGGGTLFAPFAEFGVGPFAEEAVPAVGSIYDPFRVTYAFVPQGSPLPPEQPDIGPIPYDIPYRPITDEVPEPSTWAMMLLGFLAVGGAVRRRNRVAQEQSRPPALA